MSDPVPAPGNIIPPTECEICRHLDDVETSFYKYGWDDQTEVLPPEAARLVPAQAITGSDTERHHVKRCPICGTFYRYDFSYEYLVNGSEDSETLERLTPTQARDFLGETKYNDLMAALPAYLQAAEPRTRGYAAKCLVYQHLERREFTRAAAYLSHTEADVVKDVLYFIWRLTANGYRLENRAAFEPALRALAAGPDRDLARVAGYVLQLTSTRAGT
jgi:hypothetical protein